MPLRISSEARAHLRSIRPAATHTTCFQSRDAIALWDLTESLSVKVDADHAAMMGDRANGWPVSGIRERLAPWPCTSPETPPPTNF